MGKKRNDEPVDEYSFPENHSEGEIQSDDALWDEQFESSQNVLEVLANEAREEHRHGLTESFGAEVTIMTLDANVGKDRVLVYDVGTLDAYIVPKDAVRHSLAPQSVAKAVLDAADRPYNFDSEISALTVSVPEIRLALYRSGLVEPSKISFKEFVARLLRSGIVPVRSGK